jgi:hypothetical protein
MDATISKANSWGVQMSTSEPEVHRTVRAWIDDGRLPCDPSANIRGGRGTGALCEVCGKPISSGEIEYEVQLAADAPLARRLDFRCRVAWSAECDLRYHAP